MENTTVAPALSAEAWAKLAVWQDGTVSGTAPRNWFDQQSVRIAENTALHLVDHAANRNSLPGVFAVEAELLPATIALANHALPDTDPRKITREDVADVLVAASNHDQLASRFEEDEDQIGNRDHAPLHREAAARLRALAAKLAALLPPE